MTDTVLVTGAGRGIGRATVERFLAGRWRAVAAVRDPDAARAALPADDRLKIIRLDVTDAGAVPDAVAEAEEFAGGPLACVVPNAGYALMGAAEDVDLAEARRMFETNLFGNVDVVQRCLPAMREAGRGSVICVSSIGARVTHPLLSMYHATKYAMSAWAEGMRIELRPLGVRVHVLEPGMVNTDFSMATRVTGGIAAGEGAYAALFEQLKLGFRAWRQEMGIGPEPVAEAAFAAATDPSAPFRIAVGADSELIGDAREAWDDEGFQDWLLGFLRLDWGQPRA
ncbi:MAG: SDR family NAD(P)-dependent oxidoreductase [Thermoleophilia bacterium]|nr:SDR family NAD(P)-dependent oxidoreductase [Thermoleophilia bacterium]